MDVKELLSKAQEFALKVSETFPEYAAVPDAAVTLIATDRGGIVSGSTGVCYQDGEAKYSDSAEQAVRAIPGAMMAASMVTVTLADCAVKEPAEDVLRQLVKANMANAACVVAVSDSDSKEISAIIPVSHEEVSDFLSGFDDAESAPAAAKKQLGQQSEFIGGIQIEESNPFFAAPNTATDDVKTIEPENVQNAPYPQQGAVPQPNPAAGFQFPVFNGGMPAGYPQQGAYPQMNGYPQQQGGYPQMTGYPQQGAYPQQQGGYPQMTGYPQQGAYPQQQGGYPQMTGYPQQGAYPQQGGYPQQNAYIPPQQGGYTAAPQPQSTYIPPQQHSPATAAAQSVHASGLTQSTLVSQNLGGGSGGAFRKRLNTFLDDEAAAEADAAEADATGLSKEEMLKNAKERKKVAKNNFNYKKGM